MDDVASASRQVTDPLKHPDMLEAERALPTPSLSTPALLGLSVKWANGRGNTEEKAKWRQFVGNLLHTCVLPACPLHLVLHSAPTHLSFGVPPCGRGSATLNVSASGATQLVFNGTLSAQAGRILRQVEKAATLLEFVDAASKLPTRDGAFYTQLVFGLAMTIEASVAKHTQT